MATSTSGSMEKRVLDEVVGKIEDYEASMSQHMAEVGELSDLYKVRAPKRKKGAFSNPRLPEFHRACNALSTIVFRMLTAKDPYFSASPTDMVADYDQLDTLTHTFKTQLKYSRYKHNLMRACSYLPVFGTTIVQEDYQIVGVSPFGRRIPTTAFIPRVLDQVFFDRGTTDIESSDWIATADVTSSHALRRIAEDQDAILSTWNKKALEAAANTTEESSTINPRVLQRLSRDGSMDEQAYKSRKELVMYYGKIDAMNDGIEYVLGLVNRKFLVRFHANKFQHGKRQFRISKWMDFDNALGLGLGIFSKLHRSMDANRQKVQDNISMQAYNMWKRRKNTVDDESLQIRPLQVIDVDNPDDLTPLQVSVSGADSGLKLEELLKAEFKAATLATDTLQGTVTDVTASEAVIAQNEALRGISTRAELIADSLVREHLEVMHWNNVQNIRAPFNINKSGISRRVYPADLQIDLDFEALVTTDKDFKPQRLDKLINLVQILVSTKSSHPDQMAISILPIVKQIAYMLDVNPEDVIQRPGAQTLMGAGELGPLAGALLPPPGGPLSTASTPAGDVLVS